MILSFFIKDKICCAEYSDLSRQIKSIYIEYYPVPVAISQDGSKVVLKSIIEDKFLLSVYDTITSKSKSLNKDRDGQFSVKWSNDGKKVAFFLDPEGRQDYKLRVIDFKSGVEQIVKTPRIINPIWAWSKDSRYLAFVSEEKRLIIIDLAREGAIVFKSASEVFARSNFVWSKNSNSIAYVLDSNPKKIEIKNINLSSSSQIEAPGNVLHLAWCNFSDNLLANVVDGDKYGIYELSADFSKRIELEIDGEVTNIYSSSTDNVIVLNVNNGFKLGHVNFNKATNRLVVGEGSVLGIDSSKDLMFINSAKGNFNKIVSVNLNSKLKRDIFRKSKSDRKKANAREILVEIKERRIPGLFWKALGNNNPILIMIHGGPSLNFTNQLRPEVEVLLSQGIDVVQLNYSGSSGYGELYRRSLTYAVEDVIETVSYLSKSLGYNNIYLYGDSFGSKLVLEAAAATKNNLSGLIITSFFDKPPGFGEIPKKVKIYQGENDYLCSTACASAKLKQYWGIDDVHGLTPVKEEGHSFRRIDTWAYVLSGIVNYIKSD